MGRLQTKHFAMSFYALTNKYEISWECGELPIELGSGLLSAGTSSPQNGPTHGDIDVRKDRERAIALSGDELKPPTIHACNVVL